MGIYQYTLRSDTRTVGDIEIAHFEYAYKLTSWPDGRFERMMASKSYHAEVAAEKLTHIRHVVQGKWVYASQPEGLVVYEVDSIFPEFTEELRGHRIAGILRKERGRYRIDPPEGWMITRNETIGAAA